MPDREGRLTAYAAGRTGGVVRWTESVTRPEEWSRPELLLADTGILPYLSVARGSDGYVDLFTMRRKGGGPQAPLDVVYASQYQTGRPMTGWHSIGNPHGQDAAQAAALGAPVAVVDGSDVVHVFVRSAAGGVFTRRRNREGTWGKWTALPCKRVRDGISAVVTRSGRVELFMPADKGVYVWRQEKPGGSLDRAPNLVFIGRPETASGVESYEDRITHFWRDEGTGEVVAYRLPGPGWRGRRSRPAGRRVGPRPPRPVPVSRRRLRLHRAGPGRGDGHPRGDRLPDGGRVRGRVVGRHPGTLRRSTRTGPRPGRPAGRGRHRP
ncbi:hypothetical protein OKW18_001541 [Streptomyces pratensis]|nr:hypothetical protein [Streptomyces pratensis]